MNKLHLVILGIILCMIMSKLVKPKNVEKLFDPNFMDRIEELEKKTDPIKYTNGILTIDSKLKVTGETTFGESDSDDLPYVKISNEGRAGKIELKSKGELYTTLRGYKSEDRTTLVIPNNLQVANKAGNSRFKIINTDSKGNEVNETNNDSDPGTNIKIKIPDTNDLISQIDTIKT